MSYFNKTEHKILMSISIPTGIIGIFFGLIYGTTFGGIVFKIIGAIFGGIVGYFGGAMVTGGIIGLIKSLSPPKK